MSWKQIICRSDQAHQEAISDFFEHHGAASVTLTDAGDQPVLEPAPGETPLWDDLIITALFPLEQDLDTVLLTLASNKQNWNIHSLAMETLEEQEWVRAWMDNFHPMQFGKNLWIYPSWHEPPATEGVRVLLDPGLAFGTGTHPTTALCLEWLGDHPSLVGKTVLDYGCGSGILAIAAAKLGAKRVVATDIDPQALQATLANTERNGIQTSVIHCCYPEEMPEEQFDVVLANILAGPLVKLAPILLKHLKKPGELVLSGILAEQAPNIKIAYQQTGLDELTIKQQEDWIRVVTQQN